MKQNWREALSDIGHVLREKEHAERVANERPLHTPAERKQNVLGRGRIRRDPVNRQAAMLFWTAPDISKPPPIPLGQSKPQPERKPNMSAGKIGETTITAGDRFPGNRSATGTTVPNAPGIPRDANPQEFFNVNDVAVKVIDEINKQPHKLTDLARAAFDARKVLDENMKMIGPVMEDFNARVKVALEDVRQSRMAVVGEVAHILQPLKEVRAFLLGKDYEHEISRLREFVTLCERLQALKESGFLDKVADTMLALAVQQ